ncbi:MAG: phasin family protein [Acidimicrobiales bacterium]
MAEADPLRKYVEAGIAFTQLTKAKAESIVRELVKAGDVQREQAQDRVEELLDRSRKSTDGLVGLVRREIEKQLSSMGFATRDEVDKLEARLEGRLAAMAPTAAAPAAKAAPATAKADPATAPAAAKAAPAAAKAAKATKAAKKTATRVEQAPVTPPAGSAARKAAASSPRRKPASPGGKA